MNRVIEVRNLSYSYSDGNLALQNINMEILEGERIGIIGPNGAGKTTFLLHLNGILRGQGELKVCGLIVGNKNNKNLQDIRKNVGFIFQDPEDQLFMPTVFDDVAFGPLNLDLPHEEIEKRVKEALNEVGMQSFEKKFSHRLSTGEKKRIAIATALSMKPEILVFDEPTANLDPKMRRQLIKLLKEFQMTLVIASHDLEMIGQLCNRVILLNQGRIMKEGFADEILSDRKLLEENGL